MGNHTAFRWQWACHAWRAEFHSGYCVYVVTQYKYTDQVQGHSSLPSGPHLSFSLRSWTWWGVNPLNLNGRREPITKAKLNWIFFQMWILDTKWSDLWAKPWHVWWRLVLSSSGSLNRSSKNSSGLSPRSVLIVTWAHHLLHVKSVYYLPFPYKTTFASQGWWSLLDWVKLMYNISYGITLDLFSGFIFIDPYILDIFLHIYVFFNILF